MDEVPDNAVYEFGPFKLDPAHRLLLHRGKRIPLTPKAFDTLMVLVSRPGKLVEKEDMIKAVWHDTEVEEGNLTFNIHMIRKALDANPREHKYILTVPGRGDGFVAPVHISTVPPARQASPKSPAAVRSMAVLPFRS